MRTSKMIRALSLITLTMIPSMSDFWNERCDIDAECDRSRQFILDWSDVYSSSDESLSPLPSLVPQSDDPKLKDYFAFLQSKHGELLSEGEEEKSEGGQSIDTEGGLSEMEMVEEEKEAEKEEEKRDEEREQRDREQQRRLHEELVQLQSELADLEEARRQNEKVLSVVQNQQGMQDEMEEMETEMVMSVVREADPSIRAQIIHENNRLKMRVWLLEFVDSLVERREEWARVVGQWDRLMGGLSIRHRTDQLQLHRRYSISVVSRISAFFFEVWMPEMNQRRQLRMRMKEGCLPMIEERANQLRRRREAGMLIQRWLRKEKWVSSVMDRVTRISRLVNESKDRRKREVQCKVMDSWKEHVRTEQIWRIERLKIIRERLEKLRIDRCVSRLQSKYRMRRVSEITGGMIRSRQQRRLFLREMNEERSHRASMIAGFWRMCQTRSLFNRIREVDRNTRRLDLALQESHECGDLSFLEWEELSFEPVFTEQMKHTLRIFDESTVIEQSRFITEQPVRAPKPVLSESEERWLNSMMESRVVQTKPVTEVNTPDRLNAQSESLSSDSRSIQSTQSEDWRMKHEVKQSWKRRQRKFLNCKPRKMNAQQRLAQFRRKKKGSGRRKNQRGKQRRLNLKPESTLFEL